MSNAPLDYDFNISHDGEAIVMASQTSPQDIKLGIDVMRVGLPAGIPDIPEFEATLEDMVSWQQTTNLTASISPKVSTALYK
jgi:phosphopantetheinyl transferase